jgi:hypothetical protein
MDEIDLANMHDRPAVRRRSHAKLSQRCYSSGNSFETIINPKQLQDRSLAHFHRRNPQRCLASYDY